MNTTTGWVLVVETFNSLVQVFCDDCDVAVAFQFLQLLVKAELLRHVELRTLERRFKEPDLRVDDPQVVVHEQ